MRKKSFVFAALLILAIASVCFADNSWKLGGTWNYSLNIPSAFINGYPASLTENGTITMHMTESGGTEYFSTLDQSWNGTLTVNGQKTDYNGSEPNLALTNTAYIPGESYIYTNTQIIDGIRVTARYTLRQTEENTVTGTALIKYNGETAEGTITATRPSSGDGGGGSGCNSAAFGFAALLLLVPLILTGKKAK